MGEMSEFYNELYGIWGADARYQPRQIPAKQKCRCCGQDNLNWIWVWYESKWRLGKGNKIHECKVNPLRKNYDKSK